MSLANENQTTGHDTGHVTGQDKIFEFCKQSRTAKEMYSASMEWTIISEEDQMS